MYQLTALDIATLTKGDALVVRHGAQCPNGLVRVIKRRAPTAREPFQGDAEHIIPAPVIVRSNGVGVAPSATCVSHVPLYPHQVIPAGSILGLLRVGDAVEFQFYPNAHSNGYLARARLHGDVLQLRVKRAGKKARMLEFELENSVCPENLARMCRGYPYSDYMAKDAATGIDW